MIKQMIGNRIKELRITNSQLSQEDFAKQIKLDRTYLSRVESGKQNITIENLNLICNTLGVSLSVFFAPFKNLIRSNAEDNNNE